MYEDQKVLRFVYFCRPTIEGRDCIDKACVNIFNVRDHGSI